MKKELELNENISPMFQVPAEQPSKVPQQAVETVLSKSDNTSLPNSGLQENEILRQLSEIKGELMRQRDEIQSLVKPDTPTSPIDTNNEEQQASVSGIANANTCKIPKTADLEKRDFLAGIFAQLAKLDGGAFITNFPAAIALGLCAYEACKFVVKQTLPMYESLKFPDPELACYGAIALAVGFSALSVISKSSLAKLFTAIIIAYEVILVFADSTANQSDLSLEALKSNPVHYEASEYYAVTKSDFERYKANFESNNSKVFHSAWYKKTYLDPAREKMVVAVTKLKSIEEKLESKYSPSNWELVLKVLYRLSAVAFLMLLAKESIKRGVGALQIEESWIT